MAIGAILSTVLGITSVLLPGDTVTSNNVCTETNTVTQFITEPAIVSAVLSSTIIPTSTVDEELVITVDEFETMLVDEEVDETQLFTDSLGYEAIDDYVTEDYILLDTLYSGETTEDTTQFVIETTYTTQTNVITMWGVPTVRLRATFSTKTVMRVVTSTRYHFLDELRTTHCTGSDCFYTSGSYTSTQTITHTVKVNL